MLPSSARPRRPVCTHRMISAAQNTMASATNASSSQLKRSDCAFSSAKYTTHGLFSIHARFSCASFDVISVSVPIH